MIIYKFNYLLNLIEIKKNRNNITINNDKLEDINL